MIVLSPSLRSGMEALRALMKVLRTWNCVGEGASRREAGPAARGAGREGGLRPPEGAARLEALRATIH